MPHAETYPSALQRTESTSLSDHGSGEYLSASICRYPGSSLGLREDGIDTDWPWQSSNTVIEGSANFVHNRVRDASLPNAVHNESHASKLTHEALNAHHSQSAQFWRDPDNSLRARAEKSVHIAAAMQSLDVDLPHDVVEKMAMTFDGMKPMDRFLVEPDTSLTKLNIVDTQKASESVRNGLSKPNTW